ncbi:MAG: sulfotransferase family 2 domain-containing protein [Desulfosalsimonadaceae bacterium]
MILSHNYRFIFIKTNKTAGTSIEIALSKFCGQADIISPNEPEDEILRRDMGGRAPQHYLAPLKDYRLIDVYRYIARRRKKHRFYHHMPASEIKALVGDDIWNSYYKFCVERNPWDRVISFYYWRLKKNPDQTITEFIDSGMPQVLHNNGYGLYTIDGAISVNRVCLYENLEQELEAVRNRLNLPEKLALPKAKASRRQDKRNYRDIFNPEDRDKIEKMFSREIALFGYCF